jgi:ferredoxin
LALKIIDECISCDACVNECPVDAITPEDPIYIIDPNICCECIDYFDKPSCVPVCPVDAIVYDKEDN